MFIPGAADGLTRATRWPLTGEAFGDDAPIEDADNDGTSLVFGLRFPGQRYDAVSGLNYNYYRDYEAETGRYVESDPLGITDGPSIYSYVHSESPREFGRLFGLSHAASA